MRNALVTRGMDAACLEANVIKIKSDGNTSKHNWAYVNYPHTTEVSVCSHKAKSRVAQDH